MIADADLVDRLRAGDEAAFATLVDMHHAALVRFVRRFVGSAEAAEDVAQETWLALVKGIDRFEGRSSLRTWLYRVAANIARTRAVRDARQVPFSAFVADELADGSPTVDPSRFVPAGNEWAGHWASGVRRWEPGVDEAVLTAEGLEVLHGAIEGLPPAQRQVVWLHDAEGWPSEDVAAVLEITPGNQRVLLHRGRAKVREAVAGYFER